MDNIYLITGRGSGKSLMQLKVMLDEAQGIDVTSPDYWNNNWLKEADKMIFNIGDRVEVFKPDSKYYGRVGIVYGITNIRGRVKITVKFGGYCTPCVTESFEPDDIVSVSNLKKAYDDYISNGVNPGSNYENFWSNGAYHLYSDKRWEPNVVYTISTGANTDSFKKAIEDYWKYDEQICKNTIKNLMEENNMRKFNVGDVVIVKNNVEAVYTDGRYAVGNPGDIGIVKRIDRAYSIGSYYYFIDFAGHIAEYKMREDELDLYINPRSVGLPRSSGRYPWGDSNNIPKIKKVIFNCPATIVLFEDGTKSVVKIDENDPVWDPEHGLAMALVKRIYGTNKSHSNYYDIFKKWIPEEKTMEDISIEITDAIMNGSSKKKISKLVKESIDIIDSKKNNNPCTNCPDRKTGCLTNCKKMQDYADECYNKTKKIEDDRVKEIEEKFGEKVRAMREKNKPEEVKKGFIGDFYFKKDYMAQMSPIEFLTFCRENRLMFYLENCETAVDPDACSWQQIFSYLKKGKLSATTKTKYVCNAQFRGDKLIDAVDVNYVVFSKKQQ